VTTIPKMVHRGWMAWIPWKLLRFLWPVMCKLKAKMWL